MQNHNDDTIITTTQFFKKNIPLTLFERFVCERELKTEPNCNILTPTLMAISVSFPFSRVAQPEARGPSSLMGAGFLYRILSPNWSGLQNSIGGLRAPSVGCWLSLPHLVSKLTDFLSSPSYIIVQSPTQYLPITGHRNMHVRVFGVACLIVIKRK